MVNSCQSEGITARPVVVLRLSRMERATNLLSCCLDGTILSAFSNLELKPSR